MEERACRSARKQSKRLLHQVNELHFLSAGKFRVRVKPDCVRVLVDAGIPLALLAFGLTLGFHPFLLCRFLLLELVAVAGIVRACLVKEAPLFILGGTFGAASLHIVFAPIMLYILGVLAILLALVLVAPALVAVSYLSLHSLNVCDLEHKLARQVTHDTGCLQFLLPSGCRSALEVSTSGIPSVFWGCSANIRMFSFRR